MERGDIIKWNKYYGLVLRQANVQGMLKIIVVSNEGEIRRNPMRKARFVDLVVHPEEITLVEGV